MCYGFLSLLFEQIGMGSGAFKDDHTSFKSVNQKPIRLNMAFSTVLEFAGQEIIPVSAFQWHFVNELTKEVALELR